MLIHRAERPAVAQDIKRFQCKIVEVLPDTSSMQATMNEQGAAGWELVMMSIGEGDMIACGDSS
jgi:hypothetical protein